MLKTINRCQDASFQAHATRRLRRAEFACSARKEGPLTRTSGPEMKNNGKAAWGTLQLATTLTEWKIAKPSQDRGTAEEFPPEAHEQASQDDREGEEPDALVALACKRFGIRRRWQERSPGPRAPTQWCVPSIGRRAPSRRSTC